VSFNRSRHADFRCVLQSVRSKAACLMGNLNPFNHRVRLLVILAGAHTSISGRQKLKTIHKISTSQKRQTNTASRSPGNPYKHNTTSVTKQFLPVRARSHQLFQDLLCAWNLNRDKFLSNEGWPACVSTLRDRKRRGFGAVTQQEQPMVGCF